MAREVTNFGTNVDTELLQAFKSRLPRSYTYRDWLEAMMRRTLTMTEERLDEEMEVYGGEE